MKYKALIFDLDGTAILNNQYAKPTKKLIDTIIEAKKLIKIAAATGRTKSTAMWIIKQLNLEDPCIITAGTQIINPNTKEILWEVIMKKSTVRKILNFINKLPYEIELASEDSGFNKNVEIKKINAETVVYILNVPINLCEQIAINIKKIANVNVHSAFSYVDGCYDLAITSIKASKKHAIKKLEELLNVKKEEIIGVGDSNNDLPLFEAVGFKIAMGNATGDLKKKADFIADNVENDGLAKVIEKFIL